MLNVLDTEIKLLLLLLLYYKGTVSCACAHLQRSEQTFSLSYNKSACSSVDEANFQDHRTQEDSLLLWKHPGKHPKQWRNGDSRALRDFST